MKKLLLFAITLVYIPTAKADMQWLGDVNGDGVVSIKDLTMMINVLNKKADAPKVLTLWDVNEDGAFDKKDTQTLCDILLKKKSGKKVWVSETIDFGDKGSFDAREQRIDVDEETNR